MKITVFGATGATGSCLVEQALAAGHEVTAVVRYPARLTIPAGIVPVGAGGGPLPAQGSGLAGGPVPARQRLQVVTADVMDSAAITPAVAEAGAVLSALGPRGTGPTTVSRDSAASIIRAMQRARRFRRLVTVSGSIVTDEGEGPVMRYLVKPLVRRTKLRDVCADMRRAEDEIRDSGLDWTIMRPPGLTAKPAAGRYRTAIDRNLRRGFTVSRADLAACMLALVDDQATVRRHVGIAS